MILGDKILLRYLTDKGSQPRAEGEARDAKCGRDPCASLEDGGRSWVVRGGGTSSP